ncbi:hypothetical protein AAMO2058_000682600 [Amorphochlora amoebiformis]
MQWVILGVTHVAFISLSMYTQRALLKLERKVKLQMLESPHQISVILILAYLWSIPSLVRIAMGITFPCSVYVLITQLSGSGVISIFVYRILRFTFKLAQVQVTKAYLKLDAQTSEEEDGSIKYANFLKKVVQTLRGSRPMQIAGGVFTFGLILMVVDPVAREQILGETDICTLRTSTFVLVAWLIWMGPYICFLRKFNLIDPYRIFWKIKVYTFLGTIMVFCYIIGDNFIVPMVGEPHWTLIANKIFWALQMTVWYLESYTPLHLTKKNLALAKSSLDGGHSLSDTIADPDLLNEFHSHLIKEWSPESIQFYKNVVLFEIDSKNILSYYFPRLCQTHCNPKSVKTQKYLEYAEKELEKLQLKAYEIYKLYVKVGADQEVNLSQKVRTPLGEFFSHPIFVGITMDPRDSSDNESKRSMNSAKDYNRIEVEMHLGGSDISRVAREWNNTNERAEVKMVDTGYLYELKSFTSSRDVSPGRISSVGSEENTASIRLGSIKKKMRNTIKRYKPAGYFDKRRMINANFSRTIAMSFGEKAGGVISLLSSSSRFQVCRAKRNKIDKKRRISEETVQNHSSVCTPIASVASELICSFFPVIDRLEQISKIFATSKQEIFRLMEVDSHRRFRLALHKKRKRAIGITSDSEVKS